ncbi:hypothetical protein SteCoe_35140 [Stentor coeruleus]|uniref:Uncharacterized protein n=1 Tax=Stentor coeruleus TaxID=5963 RepID=A0A1R2AT08_9CILI|nr:hypothetical protein SteCoe_35140 [Stentor coeruleus]
MRKTTDNKSDKVTNTAYFTPEYTDNSEYNPKIFRPEKKHSISQKKFYQDFREKICIVNRILKAQANKDLTESNRLDTLRKSQNIKMRKLIEPKKQISFIPSYKEITLRHIVSDTRIPQILSTKNRKLVRSPFATICNSQKKICLENKKPAKSLKNLRVNLDNILEGTSRGLILKDPKLIDKSSSYHKCSNSKYEISNFMQ